MGDHGGRTGKVRNSAIGEYEDNNPFMFMILPEKLRWNRDLYNQLKENSKQIISHYDFYATLYEMATVGEFLRISLWLQFLSLFMIHRIYNAKNTNKFPKIFS
jgi:hypothetical protein